MFINTLHYFGKILKNKDAELGEEISHPINEEHDAFNKEGQGDEIYSKMPDMGKSALKALPMESFLLKALTICWWRMQKRSLLKVPTAGRPTLSGKNCGDWQFRTLRKISCGVHVMTYSQSGMPNL